MNAPLTKDLKTIDKNSSYRDINYSQEDLRMSTKTKLKKQKEKNGTYYCGNCGSWLCLSPNRWQVHVKECYKDIGLTALVLIWDQEADPVTRDAFEWLMLFHHNDSG